MTTIKLQKYHTPVDPDKMQVFIDIEESLFSGLDIVIAGGSVRKTLVGIPIDRSDYDVFFSSADDLKTAVDRMIDAGITVSSHPNCKSFTIAPSLIKSPIKNKHTSSIYIQLIQKELHPNMESLLSRFDFTVCQFAYKNRQFYASEEAIKDEQAKTLSLNPYKEHDQIHAVRFYKYVSLGYTPDSELFRKFFIEERESISMCEFDLSSYDSLYGTI